MGEITIAYCLLPISPLLPPLSINQYALVVRQVKLGLLMNYDIGSSQRNYQKAISPEQLNQIVEAIADGRYSWACVLILRFVGYNPLHFIPQRTYSRLIKENSQVQNVSTSANRSISTSMPSAASSSNNRTSSQVLSKINDLDYLETSDKKQARLQGGNRPAHLEKKTTVLHLSGSNRL